MLPDDPRKELSYYPILSPPLMQRCQNAICILGGGAQSWKSPMDKVVYGYPLFRGKPSCHKWVYSLASAGLPWPLLYYWVQEEGLDLVATAAANPAASPDTTSTPPSLLLPPTHYSPFVPPSSHISPPPGLPPSPATLPFLLTVAFFVLLVVWIRG